MIQNTPFKDFFTEYGKANLYEIQEVVGKGSYGVVASAVDTHTGEKVAIKKINNIFEHVPEATRILREIKLLRLIRHPDIVEIKHIMLPPCRREFKDIYVVFELMETDLYHVIRTNDDLTPGHHQFFLYQLLRALKYMHSANVFHRDLKPKNILANADCKLKICDFGLARVSFGDAPSAVFWTDYVATRWYRAPELCGSFFSKKHTGEKSACCLNCKQRCTEKIPLGYVPSGGRIFLASFQYHLKKLMGITHVEFMYTPAIDIWSIGCIFAEMLTGKPLFPGKNVVHQLDLITDLLGSPSAETISRIRNEKARRYLSSMRKKPAVSLTQKFQNIDPLALRLLERLIAFDPKDRPSAEEALADPYFYGLANVEDEPSTKPISKFEFEFERRKLTKDDVRELIYREILEYHPQMLQEYLHGTDQIHFMYPSGDDQFKQQFVHLGEHPGKVDRTAIRRRYASLPRERICSDTAADADLNSESKNQTILPVPSSYLQSPKNPLDIKGFEVTTTGAKARQKGLRQSSYSARCLLRSSSISASKCVGVEVSRLL